MVFHNPQTRQVKELRAGVQARTFWGENLMFSLVELQAQAVIPAHSHPHEQGTYLLSGGFEATVAGGRAGSAQASCSSCPAVWSTAFVSALK